MRKEEGYEKGREGMKDARGQSKQTKGGKEGRKEGVRVASIILCVCRHIVRSDFRPGRVFCVLLGRAVN